MRIVKEAAERKNEILDAAEELFAARGYEATSTGDILDRVGIARGTLYYHFRSKEEILDALTERITRAVMLPPILLTYVKKNMEPYLKGKTDFEDCWKKLLNTLEIYKDE